jgi:hypothetical protein
MPPESYCQPRRVQENEAALRFSSSGRRIFTMFRHGATAYRGQRRTVDCLTNSITPQFRFTSASRLLHIYWGVAEGLAALAKHSIIVLKELVIQLPLQRQREPRFHHKTALGKTAPSETDLPGRAS